MTNLLLQPWVCNGIDATVIKSGRLQSKTKMMVFQIHWRSSDLLHWLRITHPFLGDYQTLGFMFCLF